jgi:hypothetical protein
MSDIERCHDIPRGAKSSRLGDGTGREQRDALLIDHAVNDKPADFNGLGRLSDLDSNAPRFDVSQK